MAIKPLVLPSLRHGTPAETQTRKVRHKIKPKTVTSPSYVADTFEADVMVTSAGQIRQVNIRFLDATGAVIPSSVMRTVSGVDLVKARSLLQQAAAAGAIKIGETASEILTRGIVPYVSLMYGIESA